MGQLYQATLEATHRQQTHNKYTLLHGTWSHPPSTDLRIESSGKVHSYTMTTLQKITSFIRRAVLVTNVACPILTSLSSETTSFEGPPFTGP